jgi:hypothetical protein
MRGRATRVHGGWQAGGHDWGSGRNGQALCRAAGTAWSGMATVTVTVTVTKWLPGCAKYVQSSKVGRWGVEVWLWVVWMAWMGELHLPPGLVAIRLDVKRAATAAGKEGLGRNVAGSDWLRRLKHARPGDLRRALREPLTHPLSLHQRRLREETPPHEPVEPGPLGRQGARQS